MKNLVMNKKMIMAFFCVVVFSKHLFATEFFVTPKIGAGYILTTAKQSGKEKYGDVKPYKADWFSGVVGLGIGFTTDKGIMLLFNNDLHFGGKISTDQTRLYNAAEGKYYARMRTYQGNLYFWQSALILGYSYRPKKNLSCNFGVGLSMGLSNPMAKKYESKSTYEDGKSSEYKSNKGWYLQIEQYQFGFPIHVDVQYYFTKNIGVSVELQDVIGHGTVAEVEGGFNNVSFKVGPAFRF